MNKQILFLIIANFISVTLFGQAPIVDVIKNKLDVYNRILPYEKVYVQCDRPFYKQGDDIWMAVWITDGVTNKASGVSEILTVELINPKGTVEQLKRVLCNKGRATCDFTLDTAAMGGLYKIKAYSNWMQNFGNENAFVKEIQVQAVSLPRLRMRLDMERKAYGANDTVRGKFWLQTLENVALSNFDFSYTVNLNGEEFLKGNASTDAKGIANISFKLPGVLQTNDGLLHITISYKGNVESVSRSIPIILHQIDLQFFPEGGDLVTGTLNNCAFKALNEFGKPADLEGAVFNSKHQIVTRFKSYHQGMGAFRFTPQPGEKYYALIDRPEGVLQLYPLPQAIENGFLMEFPQPMQFIHPNAKQEATVRIVAPNSTSVSLVAQVQGKILLSSTYTLKKGENTISVPLSAFPMGVAQFTLFAQKNVEVCERLVFVKKNRDLKLQITSDKPKYLPREKVKLGVKTTDANGKPVAAQLSLAVVDDKLLSLANDKSDNILSYLLLSSEVKGKIEEPAFYFNPQEAKADTAIDYLLLTQGWRRFTWKEIVETPATSWVKGCQYNAEKRILCGTVTSRSQSEIQKTRLYIRETGQETKPDANGYYEFTGLDLTKPLTLVAVTGNNDVIETTINDYTSVKTREQYYYNWRDKRGYGIITDKDTGEPIIGAYIAIKGTTIGMCSDIHGRFSINTKPGDILSISFMGYQSVNVFAKGNGNYDVKLEKELTRLDEVLVVGYGVERKMSVVGAISRVQHTRNPVNINTKQDNETHKVEKQPLQPVVEKIEMPRSKPDEGTIIRIPGIGIDEVEIVEIEEEQPVFIVVEELATFEGGDLATASEWITKNLLYPAEALEYGIEGRVVVKFIVDKNGNVTEPVIVRSLSPSCDEEVLRLLRIMPRWKPAKQGGRAVRVGYVLPVQFKLDNYTSSNNRASVYSPYNQTPVYYRSRQFFAPIYSVKEEVAVRTDFRKTIYWNPLLTTDSTGTGHAEFYTSDELTTFRTTVEGIDAKGGIGRGEHTFYTQKPVSIDAKIPQQVHFEDTISIPVILKNATTGAFTGKFRVEYPSSFLPIQPFATELTIPANDALSIYLPFSISCKRETGSLKLTFETDSFKDVVSSAITSESIGYPNKITLSGNLLDNRLNVNLPPMVTNSLKAEVVVYPSLQTSLTSAIEAMISEPHGCFEQVSANTWPNILALQYLKETGKVNKLVEEKAKRYITSGYELLKGYETSTKGFEWFGKSPAHEGLTAFGLMEFNDMKAVCNVVDQDMFNRTLDWLLSRRDNKGGFNVSHGKYGFSDNAYLLNNAYMVYALSEIGNKSISMEFNRAYDDNLNRNDAYCLALMVNSALNLKDTAKANILLDKLQMQITKGGVEGLKSETSITGSGGQSLRVETVSLLALALLKYQHTNEPLLLSCIRFILNARSFGSFGSTQANILALKALAQYAKNHSNLLGDGKVVVSVNNTLRGSMPYNKNQSEPLLIGNLEDNLVTGDNLVNVSFEETLSPANFNLNISYYSRKLTGAGYLPVTIQTRYKQKTVRRGETLRLTVTLSNIEKQVQPMTVAIIKIPAGFSFHPWQLKELQEKNVYDYYEIRNNQLFLYYRTLEGNATQTINLDISADIPGIYHSASSSCYLYYTPELCSYCNTDVLEITK